MPYRSPGRFLAPAALIVSVFAIALVVAGSHGNDGTSPAGSTGGARQEAPRTGSGARTTRIKAGDTIATIAQRHRTTVEALLSLNPGIDPQALHAGQRIRLR